MKLPYYEYKASLRSAKKRAAIKGIDFTITDEEADTIWRRCGAACEVTKIPFDVTRSTLGERRPYAPSIDRVDCSLGYTAANVRVVCVAVNIAMNEWGEDVLYRLCTSLIKNGGFAKLAASTSHDSPLPADVRLYRGKRGIRYFTRARDFGEDCSLGTFSTVEEALSARREWAIARGSRKVMEQVFAYTRSDSDRQLLMAKFPEHDLRFSGSR
jgi:hypothetical protein